jgi:3',5'-cyclic AMP phosphodiesterase CpdA
MAFPSLRRRGDLALIALNSAAVTAPLLATGALGAAQLERLPRLLEAARGAFRVVLVHHSPLPHGHARRKRLVDARALLDILGRCGAELVLHGHGHHEAFELVATDQGDMPVIGAPSASLDTPGQAGWNLYSITRTEAGWAVDVELRRTRPGAPGLSGKRLARVSLTRSR